MAKTGNSGETCDGILTQIGLGLPFTAVCLRFENNPVWEDLYNYVHVLASSAEFIYPY